jgi:hypothetical protein
MNGDLEPERRSGLDLPAEAAAMLALARRRLHYRLQQNPICASGGPISAALRVRRGRVPPKTGLQSGGGRILKSVRGESTA